MRLRRSNTQCFVSVIILGLLLPAIPVIANEVFVSNYGGTSGDIEVFNSLASGNAYPSRKISGSNSLLEWPWGLAVDTQYLYVANYSTSGTNNVLLYGLTADGSNAAPERVITSYYAGLARGIDVDDDYIYTASATRGVCVFDKNTNGAAEYVRRFYGSGSHIEDPGDVAVDENYIYVGLDEAPGAILVFSKTAETGSAPLRTITCTNSGLRFISSIAVDSSYIYVLNDPHTTTNQAILTLDKTEDGETVPVRRISGRENTDIYSPYSITIDSSYIYLTDRNNKVLKAYSITANGDVAPHHYIEPEYPNQCLFSAYGITVSTSHASRAGSVVFNDYDGDSKSDLAVYWPDAGYWYVLQSSDSQLLGGGAVQFGWSATDPVPGDYDGDGKMDVAVYHSASGNWYIRRSSDEQMDTVQFGWSETSPMAADYDGDGKTDIAVFHDATATWYIRRSSDLQMSTVQWGWAGCTALSGDFDGDSRADPVAYDSATATWYVLQSSDGSMTTTAWGWSGTEPMVGDYDGDGKDDAAAYYPNAGNWYVLQSSDSQMMSGAGIQFGWNGATVPRAGDYDGDGKADLGVWDSGAGNWYVRQSSDLQLMGGGAVQFGWSAATPVSAK